MKFTGIVRRIDDLGRVVIPKEIRHHLRLREGDPLEFYVGQAEEIVLKKHSQIGALANYAKEYADSLYETTGHVAFVTDLDAVIAVSGIPRKGWLNKSISALLQKTINERNPIHFQNVDFVIGNTGRSLFGVVAPILAEGNPVGSVVLATDERDLYFDTDMSRDGAAFALVKAAASFLGKLVPA